MRLAVRTPPPPDYEVRPLLRLLLRRRMQYAIYDFDMLFDRFLANSLQVLCSCCQFLASSLQVLCKFFDFFFLPGLFFRRFLTRAEGPFNNNLVGRASDARKATSLPCSFESSHHGSNHCGSRQYVALRNYINKLRCRRWKMFGAFCKGRWSTWRVAAFSGSVLLHKPVFSSAFVGVNCAENGTRKSSFLEIHRASAGPNLSAPRAVGVRSSGRTAQPPRQPTDSKAKRVAQTVARKPAIPRGNIESRWAERGKDWLPQLRHVDESGREFDCIVQGDKGSKFSLGCTICAAGAKAGVITSNRWTEFRYSSASLQLEDLKRHCNVSAGQLKLKIPLDKGHRISADHLRFKPSGSKNSPAIGADVPAVHGENKLHTVTLEQVRLAVQLCWGWGGKSVRDLEKQSVSSRAGGANIPHVRSSRHVSTRIIIAAGEVEFEMDRQVHIPAALEVSWAQDKADDLLLMKYRTLAQDFRVTTRTIEAIRPDGDRAVEISKDMAAALNKLCTAPRRYKTDEPGNEQTFTPYFRSEAYGRSKSMRVGGFLCVVSLRKFKEVCRNANADGEAAEQLGIRLAKVVGN